MGLFAPLSAGFTDHSQRSSDGEDGIVSTISMLERLRRGKRAVCGFLPRGDFVILKLVLPSRW